MARKIFWMAHFLPAEAGILFRAKDCLCYLHRDILCLHCAFYVKKANRLSPTSFVQLVENIWNAEKLAKLNGNT